MPRGWRPALQTRGNDLTEAAIAVTPAIRDVLAAIADTENCLLARLSGSGATCFGIYAGTEEAEGGASCRPRRKSRLVGGRGPHRRLIRPRGACQPPPPPVPLPHPFGGGSYA